VVDVRTDRKSVRIRVRLTDRLSGVRAVTAGISGKSVKLRRTSGTARRGTWTGRLRLGPCTKNVRSSIVTVRSYDRRWNEMFELTHRLKVRARDNTTPRVSEHSTHIPSSGPLTLVFNEPVRGISSDSITVRNHPYPDLGSVVDGSWSCARGDGERTSCLTGRVRSAAWTPLVPLHARATYLVELNPEGVLDVMDLAGNPFRRAALSASAE
jgi:hypothetical protein